jgi:hypothetical protein
MMIVPHCWYFEYHASPLLIIINHTTPSTIINTLNDNTSLPTPLTTHCRHY